MIEVHLREIRLDPTTQSPVLLLQQAGVDLVLPIFIGRPEASAIVQHLQGERGGRPQTHDLFAEVLRSVGATLRAVVITELRGNTFYADLHLSVGVTGATSVVSARPSDAVNLAVRLGAQLWVADDVWVDNAIAIDIGAEIAAGLGLGDPDDDDLDDEAGEGRSSGHPSGEPHAAADAEEVVAEFQSFLDTLSELPEDFGEPPR